jgi:hypothetical protein
VWVDDSNGTDADASSTAGMEVHVDGQDYHADVNYDSDHDGVNDTAIVEHDDGTAQEFIDTNHDGVADEYIHLDAQGNTDVDAHYDNASGQWVGGSSGGTGGDSGGTDTSAGQAGDMHADLPDGSADVGHATVDTNNDGVADTAIVHFDDGSVGSYTDKDGDGQADVIVELSPDGTTTTYEHTGDHQWTEVGGAGGAVAETPSHVAADSDATWGSGGTDVLEGVAKIDSATGQWISQN